MRNSLPSVSFVVEWENAKLSELDRARRMLVELGRQVAALREEMRAPPELIVLHDRQAIDPAVIQRCVTEGFGGQEDVAVRTIPTENANYYRQKNRGAEMAGNELVMFVDSDVVPEEGWLRQLLERFTDPEVSVVCGNTYVDPEDFTSRAFALFWFFPLRADAAQVSGLKEAEYFFANNVVFRKELFLRYQFPDLPMLRGQCVHLARRLREDGHRILVDRSARVSHPPPNGITHIVKRAICEGHDAVQAERLRGGGRYGFGLSTPYRFLRSMGTAGRNIAGHYRHVGLGPLGAAGAFGLALSYYGLCVVGEVLGRVNPKLVREKLAV